MARIVFGIIAVVASFMLVDSLKCNKCPFGLVGICLLSSEETCTGNSTDCYTGVAKFPSLSSFSGFNKQGCRASSAGCNMTTNSTLLGVQYETKITCCSTDKCNSITSVSGAPSTKMTFTTAVGAALLVSVLGSML